MMLDAALRAALRGVHVFPCRPDKAPHTRHGLKDATSDLEQIRQWWTRWPDALIGLPAGPNGLAIIDIDVKRENGFVSLHRRIRELGPLPTTRIASTPSKGQHWYFKQPIGAKMRPSAGKLGESIDVRAGNSYVILPPSTGYAWIAKGAPEPLPPAWVEVLRVKERPPGPKPELVVGSKRLERYCLAALDSACRELIETPRGRRNATLWNHAAAIGGLVHCSVFSRKDVVESLEWACSHWEKRTPYKDRSTIERGLEFGIANPRDITLGENDGQQRPTRAA